MSEQSQPDNQPVRTNRKVKFIFGDEDSTVSRSASLSSPLKHTSNFSETPSPNTLVSSDSNSNSNSNSNNNIISSRNISSNDESASPVPPSPIPITLSNQNPNQFNHLLTPLQPSPTHSSNHGDDTPLVSRTQRKLMLQREYSMASEEGSDTLDISHLNKELDRAHKEYAWIRKHFDPIGESLNRLNQLKRST